MTPLIIFHRGRHGSLPDGRVIKENSLEAFNEAIRLGAAMVELDVHEGMRITHDPDPSSELPTLPEVLDLLQGRTAVNIEIKAPSAAPAIIKLVHEKLANKSWSERDIVLSSFHHETAIRCKHSLPSVRAAVISDGIPLLSYLETIRQAAIDNVHIEWSGIYMDIEAGSPFKKKADQLGLEIWTWTVNSPGVFQKVCEYGVQAVFTDRPDTIKG